MRLCASVVLVTALWIFVGGGGDECLTGEEAEGCRAELLPGQFYCSEPEVDQETQAVRGCTKDKTVLVPCFAAPWVNCSGHPYNGSQCVFQEERSCRYVEDKRYNYFVAVGLSLFLGMFGIDRFYLGYPAIGLAKLCTLGFLFIGHLVDFLLILLQVVGPADRSDYYIPFYGPILREVNRTDPYLPVSRDSCA